MKKTIDLTITGMTCGSCVFHVESALKKVDGVDDVGVNLATQSARVSLDLADAHSVSETIAALVAATSKAGYVAIPKIEGSTIQPPPEHKTLLSSWSFISAMIGVVLSIPLVIPMIFHLFGFNWEMPALWQFILATPVQFILGAPFYKGAWRAIKAKTGNMDVLVVLGTSSGWLLSVGLWLSSTSARPVTYFESSSVVITLVLLGKWLEHRAKNRATDAIRSLCNLVPTTAHRVRDGKEEDVLVADICKEDILIVRGNERIPVDAFVQEGVSSVDESMLTGESMPVDKKVGDKVIAGSINGGGRLIVKAYSVGADTVLSSIIKLVEDAQVAKAPIQKLVDKIAIVFVPIVLAIAFMTFIGWMFFAGAPFSIAVIHAVSVLVVACPCAMGLATPASIMVGTGVAAKNGILIKNVEALESASQIKTVVFDKTGTLTIGKPAVAELIIHDTGALRGVCLNVAKALQSGSSHPLANAILEYVPEDVVSLPGTSLTAMNVNNEIGRGISGDVDGQSYILGKIDWLQELGALNSSWRAEYESLNAKGYTVSGLAKKGANTWELEALFAFSDTPKPEASGVLAQLRKQHLQLAMLSGDNQTSALFMAKRIGLDNLKDRIKANLLPAEKVQWIEQWERDGERVAMVGDGVNDSPSLAAATVGIAMGNGSDAAMHAADVTLLRGDLRLIPAALEISRRTVRKIRQNLFWAFFYNVVGIPLAALGYFNPIIAGAAMALSSVSVLVNALLLQNIKLGQRKL